MHRSLMKHMIAPRSQKIFLKFGKLKSKHANSMLNPTICFKLIYCKMPTCGNLSIVC
jgi:hypothetical protein